MLFVSRRHWARDWGSLVWPWNRTRPSSSNLVAMRTDTRANVAVNARKRFTFWASRCTARAGPDAALADPGAGRPPQSSAPRSLCLLWHCRELSGTAAGTSGRGAILAQDAEQPELERRDSMEAIPSDQGTVSAIATKAVSPLSGVASYRYAVNHLLTSVVRENRTLRSAGAGGGRLPLATRWYHASDIPTAIAS